jgi:threonine synthase
MNYVSIAGKSPPVGFRQALMQGIAPDGSLYVPETIPPVPERILSDIENESLERIGRAVATSFIDDMAEKDITTAIRNALRFPIPLVRLDDRIFLLELFHGPTLAFKDVGARFMAEVLSHYLKREKRHITILVATSGDTGGAVAHGFYGADMISVYVLYPSGKISRLQEQQMTTLGGNIRAVEVAGTFDDCQRLVKQALADTTLQSKTALSTANSINLGRLLPQITYYLWGYAQWKKTMPLEVEPPTIVVPSGNFGNCTAALYAKRMGLPVKRLIAATNRNDVVPHYLAGGTYTPHPSIPTLSNAMDVGDPSNWSRIEALYGYDLTSIRRDLSAVGIDDEETIMEMKQTYKQTGYLLDPHTAVGVRAARRDILTGGAEQRYIVAATAHPAKFKESIDEHLDISLRLPDSLANALHLPKQSIRIEARYESLRRILEEQGTGLTG